MPYFEILSPANANAHATMNPAHQTRRGSWRQYLRVAGLILVLVGWFYRGAIQEWTLRTALLLNDAPSSPALEESIGNSSSPDRAIESAWNTRRIVHREVAMQQIHRLYGAKKSLPPVIERILLKGALDPDLNVRETAMSVLVGRSHPSIPTLATVQLSDPDPEIRRLGLDALRRSRWSDPAPLVAYTHDSDPQVVALAIHLIERIAGTNFGVDLVDAVPTHDEKTGLSETTPEKLEKLRAGAERVQQWWKSRSPDMPITALLPTQLPVLDSLPAPNIDLTSLEGNRVQLKDFRGKTVLLNFWTTWCTSCIREIHSLVELRKRHGAELVILGISLDALTDEHGHSGGHEHEAHAGEAGNDEHAESSPEGLRQKVARFVKAHGINYPILLDEENLAGGRYNGGELPTTIVIDPLGNIRRRFIGARSLEAFEAMIADAASVTEWK